MNEAEMKKRIILLEKRVDNLQEILEATAKNLSRLIDLTKELSKAFEGL